MLTCGRVFASFSFAVTAALLLAGSSVAGTPTNDPSWDRMFWITKVARALRAGHGIASQTELAKLAALSDDAIVTELMSDPLFPDTVVDFNLFYLGEKRDTVVSNGQLQSYVYNSPAAIAAAQGASQGTADLRKLWQDAQPFYIGPLGPSFDSMASPLKPASPQDFADHRQAMYKDIQTQMDHLIAMAQDQAHFSKKTFCPEFNKLFFDQKADGTPTGLFVTGIPQDIIYQGERSTKVWGNLVLYCQFGELPGLDLVTELQRVKGVHQDLFTALDAFESTVYAPKRLEDIKVFDDTAFGFHTTQFNASLGQTLPNSSTNMDRKRASFALKRFFCDDLTPINVETPTLHAGGAHASDPSCLNCHYKLDPLAGFFKDRGVLMLDFSTLPFIVFDDGARVDLPTYEQNWKAPAGLVSGTGKSLAWNIGYIRAINDPTKNFYAEDPGIGLDQEGMFRIVQAAPEARSCMVRRVYEYFVGTDQAVDGAYMNSLVTEFNASLDADKPFDALKGVMKAAVQSQAFRQRSPQTDVCYDHSADFDPAHAIPCKADYIVKSSCLHCHSSPGAGDPTVDGLYLDRWITLADGRDTFMHLKNGKQVDPEQTFVDITSRLDSADPSVRMPKGAFMENQDRLTLYQWADEMAKKYAPAPRGLREKAAL